MAKELPYFKFEPSEWQNGNIQICSLEVRAMYLDICCSYWQRLGDLPYAFALQKHCFGNKDAMQELENAEVLENDNGELVIKFLDEQIIELSKKSEKARKSAELRWKKKKDANALRTQSESNANRIEENRIDNKKESIKKSSRFTPPSLSDIDAYMAKEKKLHPALSKKEAQKFWNYYESNGWKVGKNKMKSWRAAVNNWVSRMDNTNVTSTSGEPSATMLKMQQYD